MAAPPAFLIFVGTIALLLAVDANSRDDADAATKLYALLFAASGVALYLAGFSILL